MASTAIPEDEAMEFQDTPQDLAKKIEKLAVLIQNSNNFTVWTGAGISTNSSIPDFRSKDFGKWALQARGEKLDPKVFKAIPSLSAKPSLTHMALVTLLRSGQLKKIISSNTDGLHRRSGIHPNEVAELHGNSNKARCNKCGLYCYADQRIRVAKRVHSHETGVQCPKCGTGSDMLDTIVNFGEYLEPAVSEAANSYGAQADLLLVLGSSLRVITCDALDQIRARKGGKLVIINKQKTPYDKQCAVRIFADVDEVMKQVVQVKLGRPILPWILNRFIKVFYTSTFATSTSSSSSPLKLQVQGIDEVGNVFSWITKVELGILQKKKSTSSSSSTITTAPTAAGTTTNSRLSTTRAPSSSSPSSIRRASSTTTIKKTTTTATSTASSSSKATTAALAAATKQQQEQDQQPQATSTNEDQTAKKDEESSTSNSNYEETPAIATSSSSFVSFASAVPQLPKNVFLPIPIECNCASSPDFKTHIAPHSTSPLLLRLHPSTHRNEPPCDVDIAQILSAPLRIGGPGPNAIREAIFQLQYDSTNATWLSKVVPNNSVAGQIMRQQQQKQQGNPATAAAAASVEQRTSENNGDDKK